MFNLKVATTESWLDNVLLHFDDFLLDHTLCERKASAMGMSLVAKYPDRGAILEPLIEFSREELEHFHIMFCIVHARGLRLPEDTKDAYVNGLLQFTERNNPQALFLDRLLVPGIVEARGCERLRLVTESLPSGALKDTYAELTRAESRHHALFFRLARCYFDVERVTARADFLLEREAELIQTLPERAAVH
jgi:tRNA-(ms[2]io[6]A)-hydroxylase